MELVSERSGVNFRGQFAVKKTANIGTADVLCTRVQQTLMGTRDPYNYFSDIAKLERYIENLEKLLDEFNDIQTFTNSSFSFTPAEEIFEFQSKDSEFVIYFMSSLILLVQTLLKPATTYQESVLSLLEYHKNKLSLISTRAKSILFKINPLIVSEIEHLLENEVPWIDWKLNKCPKFEKDPYEEHPVEEKIELEEGELAGEDLIVNKNKPLFEEGELEPTIQNYIERVLIDLDPDEQIEEEFHLKNDPVFSWKLLRLVSYSRIDLFKTIEKLDIEEIALKFKSQDRPSNGNKTPEDRISDKNTDSHNSFEIERPQKRTPEDVCADVADLGNNLEKSDNLE